MAPSDCVIILRHLCHLCHLRHAYACWSPFLARVVVPLYSGRWRCLVQVWMGANILRGWILPVMSLTEKIFVFSLRISMRLFQNQDLNKVFLGKRFLILNEVFDEVLDSQWGSSSRPHWDLDFETISLRFSKRKTNFFRKECVNNIIYRCVEQDYSSSHKNTETRNDGKG